MDKMKDKNKFRKAAIVTWCYDNGKTNYGQILQCYAMQTMVHRLGYETKVIRYRESKASEEISLNRKSEKYIDLYELCYRLGTVEKEPSVRIFRFVEFIKENIALSKQCYTKHDVEQECEDVDVLFCGSDQIWNPLWFKDIYALNFGKDNQKRIAYAASGVFIENPQTELIYKELGGYLNHFDLVTVREKASIDILRKYTGQKITDVADPTLLLTPDDWNQVAAKPMIEEPYVFCYCLERIREYKPLLKRIMRKHGVHKILCIASDFEEYKKGLMMDDYFCWEGNAGPKEFIALIRDAQAVCTDSFHGMALSVVYQKQFYLLERTGRESLLAANIIRQQNLLHEIGITESRVVTCAKELDKCCEIEYEKMRIGEYRKKAENLLKNVLGDGVAF